MITDEELMKKIDEVSGEFVGQLDDLYTVVGMIVVGRLFGWRVIRLTTTRVMWAKAVKLFGDPKQLMREREKYSVKSLGLATVDKLDAYWDVVKGVVSLPISERREIM